MTMSIYKINGTLTSIDTLHKFLETWQVVIYLQIINLGRPFENRQPKETDNIGHTRRRLTKQKHNALCVGNHYAHTKHKT
jgi:hypothetical protein